MTVEYVGLADYVAVTAEVTGLDAETILRFPRRTSPTLRCARRPPASERPSSIRILVDKAAALIVHLAKNHPLPAGNKRAVWVTMRIFLEINGWTWRAHAWPPATVSTLASAVLAGRAFVGRPRPPAAGFPRDGPRRVARSCAPAFTHP